MGPRKRPKTNPKADQHSEREAGSDAQAATTAHAAASPANDSHAISSSESTPKSPHNRNSTQPALPRNASDRAHTPQANKGWYGGTWSRKANPVTQVAKESISAAGGAASDAVASAKACTPQLPTTPLKSPTVYLSRSVGSSSRSLPLATTTTKLNITSNPPNASSDTEYGSQPATSGARSSQQKKRPNGVGETAMEGTEKFLSAQENSVKTSPEAQAKDQSSEILSSNKDSSRWLNWFSRSEVLEDGNQAVDEPISHGEETSNALDVDSHGKAVETVHGQQPPSLPSKQRRSSDPSPVLPIEQQAKQPRSWLSLWGNTSKQSPYGEAASVTENRGNETSSSITEMVHNSEPGHTDESSRDPTANPRPPSQPADIGKSYGWAFWSKDGIKDENGQTDTTDNVGELAEAGSKSQSQPEDAVLDKARGVPKKVEKRQRPQSLGSIDDLEKAKPMGQIGPKNDKTESASSAVNRNPIIKSNQKSKGVSDNLLLPLFKHTYDVATKPGLIQQLGQLLQLTSPSESRHLARAPSPHRIRKALAIGIHGYFPAPLIRSVLGQPTGTSIRFANGAANAIQRWTQDQHHTCEIEKVALEGEGKIAERIELLWKLMLNWIEKIRKADFVMIACHSQGVPVAIILVAKLIAFGCVNSARIGVCAMAGVNLGPFADYKSRWISGSAGELFDFAQPGSRVSKDYEIALDEALKFGVKIMYVGSIDDQLVSLESSTFGTINHPNIYRAVFIDGRVHAPDFLSHLVGFALKLRNLGVSDHGLIRELSQPLAGSLYSGEGHSRIYDDEAVYYLAVQHALETTDTAGTIPLQAQRANYPTTQNPYILPFAMRGLLEEEYVRTNLHSEITELIEQFDDWKPSSKVLKDVKFRLEGVRSKL